MEKRSGLKVTILSGDRDTFQLATDNITIRIPRTKAGKTEEDDFDRNKVKKLIKNLSEQCDKVSNDIDRSFVNTKVEFEPRWSFTDTIEDICEALENSN